MHSDILVEVYDKCFSYFGQITGTCFTLKGENCDTKEIINCNEENSIHFEIFYFKNSIIK